MIFEQALGLVRLMIDRGIEFAAAVENPAIPQEYRQQISEVLLREQNILLEPVRILVANQWRGEWLRQVDRSTWYYWPALREYLLGVKNWEMSAVRSVDEATNHILGQLAPPSTEQFDIRGLVLGYIQSGKTANFTALVAKAADAGYRLIVVLSGIDNGLRRQTQIRLNRELVGYADNRSGVVRLPPIGQQWHQFTSEDFDGDFRPGFANYAALQGTQPVLLVIKKNGTVLRRLHTWLDAAPEDIRRTIPTIIIDDEADLASIDTRGTYQIEDGPLPEDYEEPSTINRLIRELLGRFQRKAYVSYTATPFANVLIPHDTFDPTVENDLYPKDFIVDLPKPHGYFGAEELFGRFDQITGEEVGGLDVVRDVSDDDLAALQNGDLPDSMKTAMVDFVLAGAARAQRGQMDMPATMLIHVSQLILVQMGMAEIVSHHFSEIRDEWRYQRGYGIRDQLMGRWEEEFRPVTRSSFQERDVTFDQIEPHVGPFFESMQVRVVNSATGEVLDYERETDLKAIAIGGNRLSRGLTLEGLLTSYFVRRTTTYDTLMQMGRWFGFRGGYEDLIRIYVTPELAGWYSDLALVEHELRRDIQVYELQDMTPLQLSTRILAHPAMLVTSRLKQRFASRIIAFQNYDEQLVQTYMFPFSRPDDLERLLDENLDSTRSFLQRLGLPSRWGNEGPVWQGVTPEQIMNFFTSYHVDQEARNISMPLICDYIARQNELGELRNWTVAIKGRESRDEDLGDSDLVVNGRSIFPVSRTRKVSNTNSLGVVTSPGDEEEGLSAEQLAEARSRYQVEGLDRNRAARSKRPATDGLLLIYPISRYSAPKSRRAGSRRPLYDDPDSPQARGIIALAISFPHSTQAQNVTAEYIVGTVGWRPL